MAAQDLSVQLDPEMCKSKGLPKEYYETLISRHFASLVSNETGAVLGNFASLDLKDGTATFAGTTIFSGGAVLGTRVTGGASDGVVPILRGNDFTPRLAAGAQLHLLRRGGTQLRWDRGSCFRYRDTLISLQRAHDLRMVELRQNFPSAVRALQNHRLVLRKREMEAARDSLRRRLTATRGSLQQQPAAARDTLPIRSYELRLDSLGVELDKITDEIALRSAEPDADTAQIRMDLERLLDTRRRQARDSLDVTGFTLAWLSLEYSVENTAFRLFDPGAAIESQVSKGSYATHSVGLRYSRYHFSNWPFESRFWSVSASVSQSHNLSDLDKVEITERRTFGSDSAARFAETKYTAYQGDYKSGLTKIRVAADVFQFLFERNQAALHVYPSAEHSDKKTSYNLGLGFLMSARNSAQAASTVNAEIFLDLTDLTNARDSEESLFGRSGVGLRISFPIKFRPEI
ncbi:MAG TPA: hypothetical protein VF665_19345 [Longimicrobium sp.]